MFASKIVQAVGREFHLGDSTIHINTSVGIALPDAAATDEDELIKRADTALYKAKDAGRGTYAFFNDAMTIALQRELELVSGLHLALTDNQLCLYFQPQVDLATGELIGLEALLRWDHPERGVLTPEDFLEVAERRGLILELSDWALGEACRQATEWQSRGYAFGRVAVNLSALQVESREFYAQVCRHMELADLPPALLELEFTETVLLNANEEVLDAISRLSELGVKFAIDDFGTGFSSLSYLKNLQADKIKIDQEFVRDIESDPNDAKIVRATIALGIALGLETIAEGVETKGQADFLRKNGCSQAQGFLYGYPVPASEAEALIRGS